jgi:prephenate dehydrogenase
MTADDDFGTVAVVGVGLIGGSLGMALKRRGICRSVVGIGRDAVRLEKAVRLGAIDSYSLDLADGCRDADLIVLCTPVSKIIADLPTVLAAAKAEAVVTDVGSVKSAIVAAANDDPRFIGSHPMAGSEATGVEAARETLFQDATWAVTPTATTSARAAAISEALGKALGSAVHIMPPDIHDAAVATTSHLPHVLATSLMLVAKRQAGQSPVLPAMSAGSFNDATRVAASSSELWRDICLANRRAVVAALDALVAQLESARSLVDSADGENLYRFFAEGADAKGRWRRD